MLLLDGQVHHDTHPIPMGNYVSEVGNYLSANPSDLGNYVSADRARWRGRSARTRPRYSAGGSGRKMMVAISATSISQLPSSPLQAAVTRQGAEHL